MGYATDGLTFNTLRQANLARLPEFIGSDWSLNDWMVAVTGELGEAANLLKKIRREDFTLEELKPMLEKEFADIVTYLDILAYQCGIDLGKATKDKFNEISNRVGSKIYIGSDGDWHRKG